MKTQIWIAISVYVLVAIVKKELSPYEFLDRLADLVPPPRKHRHRLPP